MRHKYQPADPVIKQTSREDVIQPQGKERQIVAGSPKLARTPETFLYLEPTLPLPVQ